MYLLFAGLKNYIYNKQSPSSLQYLSSLSVEHYVKGLKVNWLKISDVV